METLYLFWPQVPPARLNLQSLPLQQHSPRCYSIFTSVPMSNGSSTKAAPQQMGWTGKLSLVLPASLQAASSTGRQTASTCQVAGSESELREWEETRAKLTAHSTQRVCQPLQSFAVQEHCQEWAITSPILQPQSAEKCGASFLRN